MIVTDTLFSKLLKSFVAFCAIAALGIAASTPAFADQTSKSLDVNLTLGNSISVRILDSTATSDLSLLSFDLTPTASGVTSTKRAIVDVSTSNITGYKLYVEANGKDHNNQYTTDLVQGDTSDSHVIPTSTSTASNKNFWNYVNPATSTATVVPAHGNPDQIGYLLEPTTSTKANVDINVGVDTTITAGSYTNQLLFTAIANAESIDYTLYFDKNAPSGVDPSDIENFPVNQTASASATSYTFTIPDTAPTLVGYTFGGYVDPTATPGSKGSPADPYLPGDNVTVTADPTASVISGTKTLNAQWTIVSSTLTVDPNGGTWSGSSSAQTFEQDYGTTKHIDLPSANATYTISYNDNSQSATYSPNPPAPTSVSRPFTGWTLTATGGGSPSGSFDTTTNTYTYNIASDTLTAGYNTTSNTFTLPTVTKTGHTCTWHENSASGTSHASGETNVTITANTEFFAVCAANSHNVTVNAGANIASVTGGGAKDYGNTVTLGATADTGYHLTGWTTVSGGVTVDANNQFTMPDNDVEVTANGAVNTCPIKYNANAPSGTTASGTMSDSSMTYNQSATLTTNGYTITTAGYTFLGWAESDSGAVVFSNGATLTAEQTASYCGTHNVTKNLYAKWDNHYTLTVNPNGGTWGGSTSSQNFQQEYNSTKSIGNPTANATYTITYDDNSQGATYSGSPTSVERPFDSWSLSGAGSFAGGTYTYGAGNGTLTAQYNTTSNTFTLPTITKSGSTCYWAKGSASGTLYASGATYVTIDSNTTFYAVCKAETLAAACLNASNGDTFTVNNITYVKEMDYCYTTTSQGNSTFTNAASLCPSGTVVPSSNELFYYSYTNYPDTSKQYWSSTSQTQQGSYYYYLAYQSGQQQQGYWDTTSTSNPQESKAVVCRANTDSAYKLSVEGENATISPENTAIDYGGYITVEVTPKSGFYLDDVSCSSGYTCSGYATGRSMTGKQTIAVKNNNTSSDGTVNITIKILNDPWSSITNMQQMTTALCTAAPTEWGKALIDTRGNQESYEVRKLKDGKCWMVQNLRLTGSIKLYASDSDIASGNWTLPAQNTGTWCTSNSCNDANNLLASDASRGAYYSWSAATAGTGTYSKTSGEATDSICPKGWRLPTNAEFQSLAQQYPTADDVNKYPASFKLTGYRKGGNTYGGYGEWWTKSAYNGPYAYHAWRNSEYGALSTNGGTYKYLGLSVRCVAK